MRVAALGRGLVLGLACAMALAGCKEKPVVYGKVTDASIERMDPGTVRVHWTALPEDAPMDIYIANTPDAPLSRMNLIGKGVAGGVFGAGHSTLERPYFMVTPAGETAGVRVADRLLPLDGGQNFRDLGGYKTVDGRHVRWGRLFRSGTLERLTPDDFAYLSGLGIVLVCDFRSKAEQNAAPTEWEARRKPEIISGDFSLDDAAVTPLFAARNMDYAQSKEAMKSVYAMFPKAYAPAYAALFERLAAGDLPLIFHCAAGKARTGLAAALVLTALGVPRETILADYALSDQFIPRGAVQARDEARSTLGNRVALSFVLALSDSARDAIVRSDPAYLEAAFAQIAKDYGSVEAYFHQVLGIDDADLAKIRAALLE